MLVRKASLDWRYAVLALTLILPASLLSLSAAATSQFQNEKLTTLAYLAAGAMSFIVFFQGMYAYYATNSRRLLWMSAGFFIMGTGMIASAITAASPDIDRFNESIWFRVGGEFIAATFILLGTLRIDRSIDRSLEFKAYILVATIMVALISASVFFLVVEESLIPPLYTSDLGWEPISLFVELHILIFFAVIAVVYASIYSKNNSPILFWFIIGFILLTYSEMSFTLERFLNLDVGSYVTWIGRLFLPVPFVTFIMGLYKAR